MKLWMTGLMAVMMVWGQAKPAAARNSGDVRIEQKIRAKLAKSKIGHDGFKVTVHAGVATWEGRTSVVQHKGAATRMAKTAGASTVVNNIEISEGAKKDAAGNLQKARVAKVKPAT